MQMPRFAYAFDFAAICSTFGISYSWPHMAKSKEKKESKLAAQLATRKSALKHSASHQKERAERAPSTASTTASSSEVRKRITGKKAEKVFVYRTPDKSTDSIKSPPPPESLTTKAGNEHGKHKKDKAKSKPNNDTVSKKNLKRSDQEDKKSGVDNDKSKGKKDKTKETKETKETNETKVTKETKEAEAEKAPDFEAMVKDIMEGGSSDDGSESERSTLVLGGPHPSADEAEDSPSDEAASDPDSDDDEDEVMEDEEEEEGEDSEDDMSVDTSDDEDAKVAPTSVKEKQQAKEKVPKEKNTQKEKKTSKGNGKETEKNDQKEKDKSKESKNTGIGQELSEVSKRAAGHAQANSVTHKKEWDTFSRQLNDRKKLPVQLAEYVNTRKLDLFQIWLENNQNLHESYPQLSQAD